MLKAKNASDFELLKFLEYLHVHTVMANASSFRFHYISNTKPKDNFPHYVQYTQFFYFNLINLSGIGD